MTKNEIKELIQREYGTCTEKQAELAMLALQHGMQLWSYGRVNEAYAKPDHFDGHDGDIWEWWVDIGQRSARRNYMDNNSKDYSAIGGA